MSALTLADARTLIAAAEARADEIGQPMNIAVVDGGGNLIAHVRQDGAWIGSIDISISKAWTSRAFDIQTKDLGDNSQPTQQFFGIHTTNGGKVAIFAGGVPLLRDGVVVGGLGVSGGSGEQDQTVRAPVRRPPTVVNAARIVGRVPGAEGRTFALDLDVDRPLHHVEELVFSVHEDLAGLSGPTGHFHRMQRPTAARQHPSRPGGKPLRNRFVRRALSVHLDGGVRGCRRIRFCDQFDRARLERRGDSPQRRQARLGQPALELAQERMREVRRLGEPHESHAPCMPDTTDRGAEPRIRVIRTYRSRGDARRHGRGPR